MTVVTIRAKLARASIVGKLGELESEVAKKTRRLLSDAADRVLVVYGQTGAQIYYEDGQKSRS